MKIPKHIRGFYPRDHGSRSSIRLSLQTFFFLMFIVECKIDIRSSSFGAACAHFQLQMRFVSEENEELIN